MTTAGKIYEVLKLRKSGFNAVFKRSASQPGPGATTQDLHQLMTQCQLSDFTLLLPSNSRYRPALR
jgi:hypothetical protein